MTQPSPPRRIVCFGTFQCDLHSGELHKNGIKVKISDQPFRLLALLLERPGDLFSRQELHDRLWPGGTFVDFEHSVNTAVNKLRRALSDSQSNPRFIETIPRRGYRFIGAIEPQNGSAMSASAPAAEISAAKTQASAQLRRWAVRILAAIVLAGGAFALWWYTPLSPPRITHIEQVTLSARIDTPVRLVPGVDRVFYMERDGGHWNLMETSIGRGDGQRVAIPAASGMAMDIRPDGATLLLGTFEKRGDQMELWTMPAEGGAPMRLGNVSASGAVFTPDGKQIAYTQGADIWLMDVSGANAHKLAKLPAPASWLAWSPDGERLRFTMNPPDSKELNSIWEISSDGRNLHRLLAGWSHPANECCGSWTPDGRYFIFTSTQSGTNNLWALRERGSLWRRSPAGPFQLTSGPNSPFAGTPGRGGNHMYYYNGVWRQEMQRLDLKSKQYSSFFPNPHINLESYSRDGKSIVYLDTETGNLARSRADGGEPLDLVPAKLNAEFPRWSPDGQWIAFISGEEGRPGTIYIVRASGGEPEPLLKTAGETRDADWSADGKQLVLSHSLGSAGYELLLVDFATRHAGKIPGSENLAMSRWSPDGRFISATTADQDQLKLWDVAAKKWSVIARGTAIGIGVWSPDSRYLYFQDLLGRGEPLSRYDVRSRGIEPIMDFSEILKSGVDRCALYSITPDGSPIIGFNRSAYDLFAATVSLP